MADEPEPVDFDRSLQELERLVEDLEGDTLSLEQALHRFEQGIALVRACQGALAEAEQRVDQLLEREGELTPVPYPDPPE